MIWKIYGVGLDGKLKTVKVKASTLQQARDGTEGHLAEIYEPLWFKCGACLRPSIFWLFGSTKPCVLCRHSQRKRDRSDNQRRQAALAERLRNELSNALVARSTKADFDGIIETYNHKGLLDNLAVRRQLFTVLVNEFKKRKRFNGDDEIDLVFMMDRLCLHSNEFDAERVALHRMETLELIARGEFRVISSPGVSLYSGERAYFVFDNVKMVQRQMVSREWVSGSSGFTLYDHGLALNVGQSRGKWEEKWAPVNLGLGRLILTTARFIFTGPHPISLPWQEVLNITRVKEGLRLSSPSVNGEPLQFHFPDGEMLCLAAICVQSYSANPGHHIS